MEDTKGTKRDVSFSVTSSPISQVYLVWLHAAALVPGQGTPPYDRTNGTISVNFSLLVSHLPVHPFLNTHHMLGDSMAGCIGE